MKFGMASTGLPLVGLVVVVVVVLVSTSCNANESYTETWNIREDETTRSLSTETFLSSLSPTEMAPRRRLNNDNATHTNETLAETTSPNNTTNSTNIPTLSYAPTETPTTAPPTTSPTWKATNTATTEEPSSKSWSASRPLLTLHALMAWSMLIPLLSLSCLMWACRQQKIGNMSFCAHAFPDMIPDEILVPAKKTTNPAIELVPVSKNDGEVDSEACRGYCIMAD